MDEHLKDPDIVALEGISHSPPRRKAYSYSQQLRTTTGGPHKCYQNHPRNHSLDKIDIFSSHPRKNAYYDGNINSSDDEDYYRYSGTNRGVGGASDHHVDFQGVGMGDASEFDESQQLSNQPLPEFMGSDGGVGVFKVPNRATMHPNQPPCLELRPHPLRETQV